MKPTRNSQFGAGGYVGSERNQFQKDSRIHLSSSRCYDFAQGLVYDSEEIALAEFGRVEAGVSDSRSCRALHSFQY